ncbi:uncharacterized protein METZ01_LOCUS41326 [marine metagenome]|uniref:Uncharacterized protein n=1 Tax=marine metagenome TaxID=408172 RepID=A0A381R9V2_9ZZZZ
MQEARYPPTIPTPIPFLLAGGRPQVYSGLTILIKSDGDSDVIFVFP